MFFAAACLLGAQLLALAVIAIRIGLPKEVLLAGVGGAIALYVAVSLRATTWVLSFGNQVPREWRQAGLLRYSGAFGFLFGFGFATKVFSWAPYVFVLSACLLTTHIEVAALMGVFGLARSVPILAVGSHRTVDTASQADVTDLLANVANRVDRRALSMLEALTIGYLAATFIGGIGIMGAARP